MEKLTVQCILTILSPEDLDILTESLLTRKVRSSWSGRFHGKTYFIEAKSCNEAWIKLVRKGVVTMYTLQSYNCLSQRRSDWLRQQYNITLNARRCDDSDETIAEIGILLLDDLSDEEIILACEKYLRYDPAMRLSPPNSIENL